MFKRLLVVASSFLVVSCSDVEGPVFTMECLVEGASVGKATITYPINVDSKKMYWKTGVTGWHPVDMSVTGDTIKGKAKLTLPNGDILRSDDLSINLSDKTIVMSTKKYNGQEESSAEGSCTKRAANGEESALLAVK
jgi:hypothetical protein